MAKPNLVERMKGSDEAPLASDVADDADTEAADPVTQAASLIREAITDGDDESLADALKSFVTLCGSKAEPESTGRAGKPKLSLHFGGKG